MSTSTTPRSTRSGRSTKKAAGVSLTQRVRDAAEQRFTTWKDSCSGPNNKALDAAIKALPPEERELLGLNGLNKAEPFQALLQSFTEDAGPFKPLLIAQKGVAKRLDIQLQAIFSKKEDAIKQAILEAEFARARLEQLNQDEADEMTILGAEIELEGKEVAIKRLSHKPEIMAMFDEALGVVFQFLGGPEGLIENMKESKRAATRRATMRVFLQQSDGNGEMNDLSSLLDSLRNQR